MIWLLSYIAIGVVLSAITGPMRADDRLWTTLFWPIMAVSMFVVWIHEFRQQPE